MKNFTEFGSMHTIHFEQITFGNPSDPTGEFYSHLFFLPASDFRGEVPKSSLFNLETLQVMYSTMSRLPDLTREEQA